MPAHPTLATAGAEHCLLSDPVEVTPLRRTASNIRLAVAGKRAVLAWWSYDAKKVMLLWLDLKGRAVGRPYAVPGSKRFEIYLGRRDLFIRSSPDTGPEQYSLLDVGTRKIRTTVKVPSPSTIPKVQLVGQSLHITEIPSNRGWIKWLVFDRNCGLRKMPWRKGKVVKLVPAGRRAVLLYQDDKFRYRLAIWDPRTDTVVDRPLTLPGKKILSRKKWIKDINSPGPSTLLEVEGLAPLDVEWRDGALQLLLTKAEHKLELPPGTKAPGKWVGTPFKLPGKTFWGTYGLDGRQRGALRPVKSKAWYRSPWAYRLNTWHRYFNLKRFVHTPHRGLSSVRIVTGGKSTHMGTGIAAYAWTGKRFLVGWPTWDKDFSALSRRMLTRVVDCRPRKPLPRVKP